jgi:hypothetical protein
MSDGGAAAIVEVGRALGLGKVFNSAMKAFFRTTFGMCVLGLVTIALVYGYAAKTSPKHAMIAASITLLLFIVGGLVLAVKRALTAAVCDAVDKLDLGPKALKMIFERIFEVQASETQGDRGITSAKVAENLPLIQAEAKLKNAVESLLKAPDEGGGVGGFMRRKTLVVALRKIELVTLDEFRTADQEADGVDLVMVEERLGEGIDALLLRLIQSTSRKTNTLLVSILLALCIGATWALVRYLPIS